MAAAVGRLQRLLWPLGRDRAAPEITAMTWARFFDAYEPVHALVAESEGRLLGLTHYLFHRSTTAIAPNCYLQDLFTGEAARGKGVGRALIVGVYERASSRDRRGSTGRRTRPMSRRGGCMTRSRSAPALSSIASSLIHRESLWITPAVTAA